MTSGSVDSLEDLASRVDEVRISQAVWQVQNNLTRDWF